MSMDERFDFIKQKDGLHKTMYICLQIFVSKYFHS